MIQANILIVEDELLIAKSIAKKLNKLGCNIAKIVASGREAIQYASEASLDLILMDIAIKGNKDGIQITNELKNSETYKQIPIVCLSAHVLEHDKQRAYEAGADIFLEKPVRNEILLQTIRSLILT